MFKVLEGRKRRVFSPATITASIAAHLLLLGGVVYAASTDAGPEERLGPEFVLPDFPTEPPVPVEPAPAPPTHAEPSEPDAPAPVSGTRMDLETPTEAPPAIIDEPPGLRPVDPKVFGDGITGPVIGAPPTGPTESGGSGGTVGSGPYVLGEEDVEERPVLNRDGLARTMERYYPSVLRDSRMAGRVVIELIVDEDGRVRANSARVVDATHPAFGEATLRAVERFRFRPARMMGVPVPVRVTIPITWTVPR